MAMTVSLVCLLIKATLTESWHGVYELNAGRGMGQKLLYQREMPQDKCGSSQ